MAKRTGKTANKVVTVLGVAFAVIALVMIIVLCLPRENEADFIPPPFEENAVVGTPDVPEELGYSSPYREGMSYRFSVCGNVRTEEDTAVIFLTNPEENNVWLKLRIIDEKGSVLGETGLIKPGEYVKSVRLRYAISSGTKIRLKIMGYEPETYHSAGSVVLTTAVSE